MSFKRVSQASECWQASYLDGGSHVLEPCEKRAPQVELPLVSVVVVNFNYGRFLAEAVASVFAQTYPRVECIVVDNASTDGSPGILQGLQSQYPELVCLRRPFNAGQSVASLEGLALSRGRYVIFLDADDFLLPNCVDAHVYVHLSMRNHVAFTSGDMLQVVDHDVVVSTGEASNDLVQARDRSRKPNERSLRPYSHPGGAWPPPALRETVAGKTYYVKPRTARWVWSPTSGLCYRREALLLFADNPALAELRTGTDIYFALGCGGLSGSVIIDEPLFAYRVHGANTFTTGVQLDKTLAFVPNGAGDCNQLARRYLIEHLGRTIRRFTPQIHLTLHVVLMLLALDASQDDRKLPAWARRSILARIMADEFTGFAETLSPPVARLLLAWKAKSLLSPVVLRRSLARAQARGAEASRLTDALPLPPVPALARYRGKASYGA